MLIPGQNQLARPEIVTVESFETLLADLKAETVSYIAQSDPEQAAAVEATFTNSAEVLTKMAEAFVVYVQNRDRRYNAKIEQMLAYWAKGTNLDAKLADMGLERQVLDAGDPDAFPPVPPTMESDDHARQRYFLAPHAPAAGSRMHYRYEALTLDERPVVSVETPEAGKVVVTYTLASEGFAAQIKDANGRMAEPNTGRVFVNVLSRVGDGAPSASLLAAVRKHFAREDVAPGSDDITVRGAEVVPYRIKATAWINPGPDAALTRVAGVRDLQHYADERHILGGRVDRSWIDYVLHAAGAVRLEINEPAASVVTEDHQAPYCTGIEVEIKTL